MSFSSFELSVMGETEGSAHKARPSYSKAGYCYPAVAVSILETNCLIHLTEINRSDSAVHLSNNWGLINCNVDVRTESYTRPSSDEEGQEGICFERTKISTTSQSPFHTQSQITTNQQSPYRKVILLTEHATSLRRSQTCQTVYDAGYTPLA